MRALTGLWYLQLCNSFTVLVPHGSESCFMEEAQRGDAVLLSFGVQAGGKLDIDVKIYAPDMKLVYKGTRENENDIQFVATTSGMYRVCFENKMSTITNKVVSFHTYVGKFSSTVGVSQLDPIHKAIDLLQDGVSGLNDHQAYMHSRLDHHEKMILSTPKRFWWCHLLNLAVLFLVGIFQVLWLRRGFERKRIW
jgi:hypothetical protein